MPVYARQLLPLVLLAALAPRLARAQDVEERGRQFGTIPPPGYYEMKARHPRAFQFSEDQGWARRADAVARRRQQLRGQLLNSGESVPMQAHFDDGVLTGDLHVPVFLILFDNTDSANVVSFARQDTMQIRLYGTDPAPPYSVHTLYRELSNDLLNVNGTVLPWTRVTREDTYYEGNCNGLCSDGNVEVLIENIVALHDETVDFGQFDNDGLDGVPNSGDDDGYVDALVLLHPEMGGECGNSNIWAHRFTYQGWGGTADSTNDAAFGGGTIRFRDYIIQGAEGGDGGCVPSQPAALGTISHETGHLFGLPDLYDTSGDGSGVGRWDLMSSGNQQTYDRPAHMSAWTKAQLGWVTEVLIERDTVLEISPVVTSDTAFLLPAPNSNQYFILENRQRIGSDFNLINEGLLIWHVDSVLARLRGLPDNRVNAFQPYAVALEQADGLRDLEAGVNRGDRDDPFPGDTGNTSFGRQTSPSSLLNSDTGPTFVEVDSITQLSPIGPVRVRIGFERPALVAASDTTAVFRLDGADHTVYRDFLTSGREYQLDMDPVQLQDNGRRRYTWVSWSNSQPRTHAFIASDVGDTITANVDAEFLLQATVSGNGGSIAADAPLDLANGELLPRDSVVTLTATVDSTGHVFEGWLGSDTVATGTTLVLTMHRPFTVDAFFAAPLAVPATALPGAVMGTPYTHSLAVGGGTGTFVWRATGGALPDGLTLDPNGIVSGLPRETGDFTLNVEVESGSQIVTDVLSLEVVAPVLVVADVVQHLAGDGQPLADTDETYLDLIGNRNNRVDVGDFLAWIQMTGGTVTASEMAAVVKAAGRSAAPQRERR